jgi:serine protease
VVAVLDTGVRFDHPDLAGKLLPGYDFVSADSPGVFASSNDGDGRDADPSDPGDWVTQAESDQVNGPLQGCPVGDSVWHGTQTSALIGALSNNGIGMASVGRNVRVLPVRVLGKCGGFQSDVIAGMYWAAGLAIPATTSGGLALGTAPANPFPAKVLNMSLGSATTTCAQSYQDAFTAVTNAGASVVVSAGNDRGLAVGQPANCASAIGVGGLRHTGTKVAFSDVGPQIAISSPGGNCVNLADPCLFPILTASNTGTQGPSTNTFTDALTHFGGPSVGTSYSAPLVSGTIALMLSVNPTLTPANVRSILTTTARAFPPPPSGVPMCRAPDATVQDECGCTTSTCGAGMLDTNAAVTAVTAPATTQPLIFATPAAPAPTVVVTLDGSTSVPAAGRTIDPNLGYQWTLSDPGGIAAITGAANRSTVTVSTIGEGRFIAQLQVTDSNNVVTAKTLTVVVANPVVTTSGGGTNPPSGGGGALSWFWLSLLAASLWPLRRQTLKAATRRA